MQGGIVSVAAQGAKLALQTATTMLLARLLSAEDFGLQGMAVVLTGFLLVFSGAGLGAATVNRLEVTPEQISTLFWINVAVGAALATLTAVLAPAVVAFYGEPRLYWITVFLGLTFVFSGLSAQHQALILREMRFATLAKIDLLSLTISSASGVVMALLGWRYWALVGMVLVGAIVSAASVWVANPWIPGLPRRRSGVLPMLHFGWMAICNNLVVFLAWNSDNILLGRFWGADALGLYGRAYQLATLPVHQLNAATAGVAFSALSRIQDDADRLARSFLRGYSLLVSLTIPITISCALFAEEIVYVMLGAKWMEAAPIFRLLTPTGLVFALANPLSCVGHVDGPDGSRLEHFSGDNAAGDRGDRAGPEPWTPRSGLGVLVGYGTPNHPDYRLVYTRHQDYLGGSLESHQTTALVRFAGGRDRPDREDHARWYVGANPVSVDGAWSCLRCLRLGSSDCDGPEKSIHGPLGPCVPRNPPCQRRLRICPKKHSPEFLNRSFFESIWDVRIFV